MKRAELKRLAVRKAMIRITRSIPGTHPLHGFMLGVGRDLVLVADEDDYLLNGYSVLRVGDFAEVLSADSQELQASWMREEGLLDSLVPAYSVDVTDMASVFRSVRAAGLLVSVENEDPADEHFFLGRIVRVNRKSVSIVFLDAKARWWWNPSNLKYDAISRIRFGDRYSHMLGRHTSMMPACPVCGLERDETHDEDAHS